MHPHPTATLPDSSQGSSLFSHSGILHLLLHVDEFSGITAVSICCCIFPNINTLQFLDFWFWCFDVIYSFIFSIGNVFFGWWWLMFSKLLPLFDWNLFLIFPPGTKMHVVLECKPLKAYIKCQHSYLLLWVKSNHFFAEGLNDLHVCVWYITYTCQLF